jgi:hypothetical protein
MGSLNMLKLWFKNITNRGWTAMYLYKKIRKARPYRPSYFIDKIECRKVCLNLSEFYGFNN